MTIQSCIDRENESKLKNQRWRRGDSLFLQDVQLPRKAPSMCMPIAQCMGQSSNVVNSQVISIQTYDSALLYVPNTAGHETMHMCVKGLQTVRLVETSILT